jgi:hypothetical protein
MTWIFLFQVIAMRISLSCGFCLNRIITSMQAKEAASRDKPQVHKYGYKAVSGQDPVHDEHIFILFNHECRISRVSHASRSP